MSSSCGFWSREGGSPEMPSHPLGQDCHSSFSVCRTGHFCSLGDPGSNEVRHSLLCPQRVTVRPKEMKLTALERDQGIEGSWSALSFSYSVIIEHLRCSRLRCGSWGSSHAAKLELEKERSRKSLASAKAPRCTRACRVQGTKRRLTWQEWRD